MRLREDCRGPYLETAMLAQTSDHVLLTAPAVCQSGGNIGHKAQSLGRSLFLSSVNIVHIVNIKTVIYGDIIAAIDLTLSCVFNAYLWESIIK